MATFDELVEAERKGVIGPKSKVALERYRKQQTVAPLLSWQDTPDERQPGPPHNPNALTQLGGGIVGGILNPALKLGGGAGTAISQGLGGSPNYTFHKPPWAGGDVDVTAPQTPSQSLRQLGGPAIETLAAVAPIGKGLSLAKQGLLQGGMYGLGMGVEKAKTLLGALGYTAAGAAGGATFGKGAELAGKGIQAAGNFAAESAQNIPGMVKDFSTEGAKKAMGDVAEMATTPKTAKDTFVSQYLKAVKPYNAGKTSAGQIQKYTDSAFDAGRSIIENKANLNLVNQAGERTDTLPQSLHQFSVAIDKTINKTVLEADAIRRRAGDAGATVKLAPTEGLLTEIANSPEVQDLQPSVAKYAKKIAESFKARDTYTLLEAHRAITRLNARLTPYYANPTYEAANLASIDEVTVRGLRKALAEAVQGATGEAYQPVRNKLGSLLAIKEDVAKRTFADAKNNTKGVVDLAADISSASDLVRAMVSRDPAVFASGLAKKSVAYWLKAQRNPNRIVKQMFSALENSMTKQTTPLEMGIPTPPSPEAIQPGAGQ